MKSDTVEKRIFFGLFAFVLLLLLLKISTIGVSLGSDGLGYYAYVRSVFIDHDLDFTNEFRNHNPLNHYVPDPDIKTQTGHVPNKYPIGPAFLWIPFFLIAHALAWLSSLLGYSIPQDGYSLPYQVLIGLGPQIYGILGLILTNRIIKLFYPPSVAILAVMAVALGTNIIYYLTIESTMSHAFSLFAVSLFIYFGINKYKEKNTNQYFIYGLLGALMTLTRYQNGLFMIFPLFEMADGIITSIDKKTAFRSYFTKGLIYLSGFFIGIIPQLFAWKVIYGQFFVYGYGEGFFGNSYHFVDLLFSPRHGLITWTPMIFLCLVGLSFLIYDHKKFGVLFLILFLLQYFINASWKGWTFGSSYSIRAFINCTFIFSLGLSAVINNFKIHKYFIFIILSILVAWNFLNIIRSAL